MEFHGSKTEKNLLTAFTGECHARNKYTFYSSEAKKAGYVELSKIYDETADNEKEHAKVWFKHLHDGNISDTITNLKDCIENEAYEHFTMYPTFAREAEEEGFREIAMQFRHVAEIEGMHHARFEAMLEEVQDKTMFKKEEEILWECSKCGFLCRSCEAPKKCPVCEHPQGYFMEHSENY